MVSFRVLATDSLLPPANMPTRKQKTGYSIGRGQRRFFLSFLGCELRLLTLLDGKDSPSATIGEPVPV